MPDWQRFAGLFLFAFLIRLIYLLEIKDTAFFAVPIGDAFAYDAAAMRIQDDWIGKEVFYQAPFYPYFLAVLYALFGHDLLVVRLVQIALGSASCVLLALAGRSFFSRAIGLGAGFLLATYGPAIFFDGLLHKASLDLFFTTGLLACLGEIERAITRRWLLLGGVCLGCLALTRENALALIPLIGAWLGYRTWHDGEARGRARRFFASCAPMLLGTTLVLGPVAARNFAVGGEPFITTSQAGVNFYIGNNADADGTYAPLRFGHGSFPLERADAIEIAENAAGHPLSPGGVSRYWSGRARAWMASHPGDWLKLLGRKWLLVWNEREIPDSDEPLVYADASFVLTAARLLVSFGTICPLAVAGMIATWRDRRRLVVLYVLLVGAAAGTALFFVFARYRVPMIPILVLFAMAGLLTLVRLVRDKSTRPLLGYAALIAAAGVATRIPLGGEDHPRAMPYYNLAVSLEAQGDMTRAEESYRKALADNADFEEAHVNLGALLAKNGQLDEAIDQERAALRSKPDDATAHTNLANALLESGQLDEAEQHYRVALRLQPDMVQAQDGFSVLREIREQHPAPNPP
jgi:tetratricopeptide (TPR) repeat protein